MGCKRWLQLGSALILAGVLIVAFGKAEAYSDLSASWARDPTNRIEGALLQAVQRVQLWTSVGGFTVGIGVIVVTTSLCSRWFVKPPAPNPDAPPESN